MIPINFPKPFDLTDVNIVEKLTLQQLKRWNQAPSNLSILQNNNISFSITPNEVKSSKEFFTNLRKAISYGLTKEKALEALTTVPAKALNMHKKLGTLNKGYYANILVSSGPIFEKESILLENWVLGNKHVVNNVLKEPIDGTYTFENSGSKYKLVLKNSQSKISATLEKDSIKLQVKSSLKNG